MADLPAPATSAEEIRRITKSVLSRPEFGEAEPSLLTRALRAIGDFIARLVELVGAGGRGSIIGTVVLLGVAALFTWAVVRFTRTVRADPTREVAVAGQIGRTAEQWVGEAAARAAEGLWREAVRCRYRAVLAELAATGLVEEVAGRTSGEYLAAVTNDVPGAAASFLAVTRRFEAAWYGHDPTTAEDVEAFEVAARAVAQDAGIRRPTVSRS